MAAGFPVSKSQQRVLSLLSLSASDSIDAQQRLQAAGFEPDGVPQGHTWRTAARLSDAELLATGRRVVVDLETGESAIDTTITVTRPTARVSRQQWLKAHRNNDYIDPEIEDEMNTLAYAARAGFTNR